MLSGRRDFLDGGIRALARRGMHRVSQALMLGLAVGLASPGIARGAPLDEGRFKIVHRFSTEEGSPLSAPIFASDGKFYGVLRDANTLVYAFYRMLPGGQVTVLRRFDQPGDPKASGGFVEGSDQYLYATSAYDGEAGVGMVYRINRSGERLEVLHSFSQAGCYFPGSRLIQARDGNFYGTTFGGGRFHAGCVYRMTRDGEVTVLHEFEDRDDGSRLYTSLVEASDGLLYGVASDGGRHRGGTVFRLNRQGFFQVLHHFHKDPRSPDGRYPNSALAEGPGGMLYGTTSGGNGTIYRIDLGRNLSTLHRFNVNDGLRPNGTLCVGADGTVTGNTSWAGGGNNGVVYQLHPDGSYHVLHTFAADGQEGSGGNGLVAVGEDEFHGIAVTPGETVGVAFRVRTLSTGSSTAK